MRALRYFVLGVGLGLNVVVFACSVRPSTGLQLGGMLLSLVLLGLLAASLAASLFGSRSDRSNGRQAGKPSHLAALLLVTLVPATLLGYWVRERRFEAQRPRFEEIVAMLGDGRLQAGDGLGPVSLPARYQDLGVFVLAEKAGGILTVEFLTGGGFPVKHTGYLYRSAGRLGEWRLAKRWPRWSQIDAHWYRISD
jgi:heme A synthase